MKLQKSFRLAWNILVHSKLRSWLTVIGIVIGVAAIVAIVSIGEGAQASVQARLGGLGADILTVTPGFHRASSAGGGLRGMDDHGGGGRGATSTTAQNITNKDIQIIKSVQGVTFVNGIIAGRSNITYLAEIASVSIQGVDSLAWRNMVTTELDSGRYLNSGDTNSIVIGNRLAVRTFKQPLGLNMIVSINGKPFKIVGILKEGGFGGDDNSVFMPIEQAKDVLDKADNVYDSISFKVNSPDISDQAMNETDSKLMMSRHVNDKTKDFTVTSSKAIQESITSVTQTFTIFLAAIAAVSLIVGAVGIANTMFTSVLEKTREIGIMKAIGAKNSDILLIFLMNSGMVGMAGGLFGIMIGAAISFIIPNLLSSSVGLSIKTVIPISLLVEALVVSVMIGMIAGAIPAYRASKLKPVDALRYE